MARKLAANLDLLLNEIQNAKVHIVSADPASPVTAQIYYNSTTNVLKFYNGTAWVSIGYLNQMTATGAMSMNGQLISSLADPVSNSDAATKQYVDNAIQGLDPKYSCVCATTANITLSGTQTIDGIAVVAGDRVLVKNQTTASQNGIYVVSASAWARATDCDVWTEFVGAFTFVEKGTSGADTGWLCSVDQGGTLGTTSVTWVQFSAAGQITAANLTGTGTGTNASVFSSKSGLVLNFRQISTDTASPITLTQGTNEIKLDLDAAKAHDNRGLAKFFKGTFTFVSSGTDIAITHNMNLPAGTFNQLSVEVYETASGDEVEVDRGTTAWTANIAYIKMTGSTGLLVSAGAYTVVLQG